MGMTCTLATRAGCSSRRSTAGAPCCPARDSVSLSRAGPAGRRDVSRTRSAGPGRGAAQAPGGAVVPVGGQQGGVEARPRWTTHRPGGADGPRRSPSSAAIAGRPGGTLPGPTGPREQRPRRTRQLQSLLDLPWGQPGGAKAARWARGPAGGAAGAPSPGSGAGPQAGPQGRGQRSQAGTQRSSPPGRPPAAHRPGGPERRSRPAPRHPHRGLLRRRVRRRRPPGPAAGAGSRATSASTTAPAPPLVPRTASAEARKRRASGGAPLHLAGLYTSLRPRYTGRRGENRRVWCLTGRRAGGRVHRQIRGAPVVGAGRGLVS